MKLIGKHIERDRSGRVTLCPEESEDMWHVYNLILKGDRVKSTTERRIRNETSTGSAESHRMRLSLTIEITDIDFDPSVCLLRLNGKNLTESPHIKLGAYHTVDLELHQNFTLYKNEWDSIALDRVSEACDVTKRADAGAVILQEGLANVCLLTQHMTLVRQRLEVPIPRKRRGSVANYEKGIERFFVQIYEAITRHFDFDIIKVIIIAGPGFIKDQFYDFLFDYATKKENKVILKNKSKFLSIHASSGHKHSLQEVMENPSIQNRLADTKAAFEVNTLQKFYDMLNNDPDRAFYGWSHVNYAAEQGAIMTLLISDGLFRSDNIQIRRQYTKLVESVKDGGGNVAIFSSLHVSGEQLNQLTGIAAILKFPLPDIDDLELMNLEDEMKLKHKDQYEDEINY